MISVQDVCRIHWPCGRNLRPEAHWLTIQMGQVWLRWKLADGRAVHGHRALDSAERAAVTRLLGRAAQTGPQTPIQLEQGADADVVAPHWSDLGDVWARFGDIAELTIEIRG